MERGEKREKKGDCRKKIIESESEREGEQRRKRLMVKQGENKHREKER